MKKAAFIIIVFLTFNGYAQKSISIGSKWISFEQHNLRAEYDPVAKKLKGTHLICTACNGQGHWKKETTEKVLVERGKTYTSTQRTARINGGYDVKTTTTTTPDRYENRTNVDGRNCSVCNGKGKFPFTQTWNGIDYLISFNKGDYYIDRQQI